MEEENNKRACVADNDTTWKTNAFDKGKIKPAHHKERKKERKRKQRPEAVAFYWKPPTSTKLAKKVVAAVAFHKRLTASF